MLMPERPMRPQTGVTLIELIVVMVLVGVFIAMAAPTFTQWMQNSRIRNTAGSISAGLQLAKAEAVARNTMVRFQLTTTLDATCELSANGGNWVVNITTAPNGAANTVEDQCHLPQSTTVAPQILHTRTARDGGGNSLIEGSIASVTFNGLGRQSPQAGVAPALATFEVKPAAGVCTESITCLRILVSAAGQVRMCNPSFAATDPQGCPANP